MKVLYKSGETLIIKVSDNLVYYGNGKNINAFGDTATQFLRFNSYMTDVSESNVEIPAQVVEAIKSGAKRSKAE